MSTVITTPTLKVFVNQPNLTIVEANGIRYAFSYETCIGFAVIDGSGWMLRRNEWGPSTGRHLNALDGDHAKRLSASDFAAALSDAEGQMADDIAERMQS